MAAPRPDLGKIARATRDMIGFLEAYTRAARDVDPAFAASLLQEQARELLASRLSSKIGRPSTYDRTLAQSVLTHIASGFSRRKACLAAGVHNTTFDHWAKSHSDLGDALRRTENGKKGARGGTRARTE